jgi:uncharacterized protein
MLRFLWRNVLTIWTAITLAPVLLLATPQMDDPLLEYAGVYTVGDHHDICISLRKFGEKSTLVLSDIQTDEVRMLFPQSKDRFVAGTQLTQPQPIQYHISFNRDSRSKVASLTLRDENHSSESIASKQTHRKEPANFLNGNVRLLGDLHLPKTANRRHPAVVLGHGSEDSDRYSFDCLPYVLAHHGVAVLAYDKRGTGRSSGSWQDSGLEALADDLQKAVVLLKSRSDIDPNRIGVIGFSEGGWVAPLAASKSSDIHFIVSISGGAFTKGHSFIQKYRQQFAEQGLAGESLERALAEKQAIVAGSLERVKLGKQPSGFDLRITYDPTEHWRSFKGPVLYLIGEYDSLEPAEQSAQRLFSVLTESKNPDFTIKVFPRTHHGMFLGVTGRPSEFSMMKVNQLVPGYWDTLIRWLETRLHLK